ncbi:two-component hybrid sensor and regulator [Beggiatoa sp. PS]|nr:two-component hybrid sensor and regulator [Beggiatoa sp. PS]
MSMVVKTPATSLFSFQGYTILIIEDNPNNLGVIVDYLEEAGLKVVVARNGEMGLKRAQFAQPDIILLDVMMPGIDGFETCRRLKADAKTQEIPVIFMTALDDPEDKLKGFGVGGVDYITKPIQHEEVLARVTTHLRIRALTLKLNAKIEELIQTRNELVQNEKMASLGRLVAGFAHEINTPIGVAVGAASTLEENANAIDKQLEQEEVNEEELLENLKTVKEAARLTLSNLKRASHLITSFKRTAIDQSSDQVRRFEVKATIEDIINTLHNQFKRTAIDIQVDCPRDLVINSMPGALEQIITNLMMNSLIHGFDEGKNTGSINIKAQLEDNHLHLEYSDTGKGIAPENVEKIFEPFFTTYRAQGGSGLGMYICYNLIVTQLNGTIICESIPGKGIVFKINYPIDLKN